MAALKEYQKEYHTRISYKEYQKEKKSSVDVDGICVGVGIGTYYYHTKGKHMGLFPDALSSYILGGNL